MRVLCIFSTNFTLGIRTKDLHSIVRSRRPVVVLTECPQPQTMAPTAPPELKVLEPSLGTPVVAFPSNCLINQRDIRPDSMTDVPVLNINMRYSNNAIRIRILFSYSNIRIFDYSPKLMVPNRCVSAVVRRPRQGTTGLAVQHADIAPLRTIICLSRFLCVCTSVGECFASSKRRCHLPDKSHFHLHPGAGSQHAPRDLSTSPWPTFDHLTLPAAI